MAAGTAKSVRVWLDPEADYLEVIFDPLTPGYFRQTADDRVMEKVDEQGNVIGFSIMPVSSVRSPMTLNTARGPGDG